MHPTSVDIGLHDSVKDAVEGLVAGNLLLQVACFSHILAQCRAILHQGPTL